MKITNPNQHAFDLLSKSITVTNICNDFFGTINMSWSPGEVRSYYFDKFSENDFNNYIDDSERILLVQEDGKTVGYVSGYDIYEYTHEDYHDEEEIEQFFEQCLHQIDLSMIVSSDTSIMDFVIIVGKEPEMFFVIQNNQFIGYLTYSDLNKSSFHLCLFALFLDLEEAFIFALWKSAPIASIKSLKENRIEKAKKSYSDRGYDKKYGPVTDEDGKFNPRLLECTMLIDKITMLRSNPFTKESVPGIHDKKHCQLFERTRNIIAHPSVSFNILERINRKDLIGFYLWILQTMVQINRYRIDNSINQ
jgi:hypothetical protein